MQLMELNTLLKENAYPGRGIVLGLDETGKKAVVAYFIMGRSENSRNRVFVEKDGGMITKAFDESKMVDPSLIIYAPVRLYKDMLIVTNGDQTDTIHDYLKKGSSIAVTFSITSSTSSRAKRISGLSVTLFQLGYRPVLSRSSHSRAWVFSWAKIFSAVSGI